MAKTLSVGCALLLIGLSQISLAVGETHLECIRNRIDFLYGEYNWYYGFDFLWNYAATADTLPSIFQGKLNGTGIYCANAVDDPRYVYLFIRDDERLPALTPAYLYVKYYFHATNASNVNLSARPAKGMDGLTYYLPTNDKFRWEEQLIEIDIEAVTQNGYWVSWASCWQRPLNFCG